MGTNKQHAKSINEVLNNTELKMGFVNYQGKIYVQVHKVLYCLVYQ